MSEVKIQKNFFLLPAIFILKNSNKLGSCYSDNGFSYSTLQIYSRRQLQMPEWHQMWLLPQGR